MFGTDGVRGLVNKHPMTPDFAMKFGMAVGIRIKQHDSGRKYFVVIAKDTRRSGYMFESALVAGLVSVGLDVTLVGPMPTPAVPMLTRSLKADFGIMITASHNPHYDNGLKMFRKDGIKLSKSEEEDLEKAIIANDFDKFLVKPEELGRVRRLEDASGRYIEHTKSAFPKNLTLNGLRIVIDSANGAGYRIAPKALWELGAEVISINDEPNGININAMCGAIHTEAIQRKVVQTRADLGIALDGDADRLVVCDEEGSIIDGDHLIAAVASHVLGSKSDKEKACGIVITEISNGAVIRYMKDTYGVPVWSSKVGDRNVAEEMIKKNSLVGGESSGHIIIGEHSMTGDGLVASLHFLAAMIALKKKASHFGKLFTLYPQYRANIHYYGTSPLKNEQIRKSIKAISAEEPNFRIIVRPSGTEDVIRIMIEGDNEVTIKELGERIKEVIVNHISSKS